MTDSPILQLGSPKIQIPNHKNDTIEENPYWVRKSE